MNTTTIKTLLRKFRRDNEGYVTIEVMFMLPVLFVLFGAAWVYFDVFRQQSVNQKANYAIGDMLSRETEEIDDTFIDNSFKLFGVLTKNVTEPDELTGRYSADLRITVVEYNANSRNTLSDSYYRARLVDALGETVTPVVSMLQVRGCRVSCCGFY